jgi:5-methylcytosine-specific restriction endonuclease McrA
MPPGWGATRARILRRDPTCRICWAAPATEVHHTQPGAEDDAHLIGACHPCHHAASQAQAAAARLAHRP